MYIIPLRFPLILPHQAKTANGDCEECVLERKIITELLEDDIKAFSNIVDT